MNVDPESAYWARIHAIVDAAPPLTVEQIAGIAAMLPPLSPAKQLQAVRSGRFKLTRTDADGSSEVIPALG